MTCNVSSEMLNPTLSTNLALGLFIAY